jgi:hypothetical protein
VKNNSTLGSAIKLLFNSTTSAAAGGAVLSIIKNFFVLQYKGKLQKKIPVKNVDHALDKCIPFLPGYVKVYMDFSGLWIRTAAQILAASKKHIQVNGSGEKAQAAAVDFINGITGIYEQAALIYRIHLSTTTRPKYLRTPPFLVIHVFDPHLMCIPSLHVMVMIWVYAKAKEVARSNGFVEIEGLRERALAITDSVLFIKQHSVNCIAAAMYAMTRFAPAIFPESEASAFSSALFTQSAKDAPPNAPEIRAYIYTLYKRFLDNSKPYPQWEHPLLEFLADRLK